MQPSSFPGFYRDPHGQEAIEWQLEPARGFLRSSAPDADCFELSFKIRSVEVRGMSVDDLEVSDRRAADAAGLTVLAGGDELAGCELGGDMPFELRLEDGQRYPTTLRFVLDARVQSDGGRSSDCLRISLETPLGTYEVADETFEDCLRRIQTVLPPTLRMRSCVTCRWSAVASYGRGMLGMSCNRDSREQHLSARDEAQIWQVPLTEWVPETYQCGQFEDGAAWTPQGEDEGVTLRP